MPTLAEQVAALEAERDAWRERADIARSECAAAESRLAEMQAERDAHRLDAVRAASAHLDTLGKLAAAESRLAQSEADAKKAIGHADWLRKKYEDCRADLAVAESRLASARVEAFKAGWNDFAKVAKDFGLLSLQNPNMGPHNVHICGIGPDERFAKLYPAPAAPAGEQETPCHRASNCLAPSVCATGGPCQYRPAPTPEPEPLVLVVDIDGKECEVTLTPTYCRLIVALGSRPTQTAEG